MRAEAEAADGNNLSQRGLDAELFSRVAAGDGKVHSSDLRHFAEEAGYKCSGDEWRRLWAELCQGAMVHPRGGLDLPHLRRACRSCLTKKMLRKLVADGPIG